MTVRTLPGTQVATNTPRSPQGYVLPNSLAYVVLTVPQPVPQHFSLGTVAKPPTGTTSSSAPAGSSVPTTGQLWPRRK